MDDFLDSNAIKELTNEYYIIHLIYHRNRNQHRLSVWWKYFNIIHRKIRQIVKLFIDRDEANNQKTRSLKENEIVNVSNYLIRKKVISKAYYEFNGIIALGQFLTLGLALVASLSKINSILIKIKGVNQDSLAKSSLTDRERTGFDEKTGNEPFNDEELGVPIKPPTETQTESAEKKRTASNRDDKNVHHAPGKDELGIDDIFSRKKRKQRKHKKKNDIDKIFGF
ncbi:Piso0_005721 [Millerozyma farinosa CBS 7064]|uniref:Piso0_005721 protein n=1 Tax=Pichia sorbitophila (strain ATCC MYA-4447 / BCRC 22081 / CBS 7064 / NBRC 10061 / NRRL Y-12695) TaxID=559304 RepID=G8Y2R1_PICSO|nr:Piso0_005721 [Millerozyma farinosa CBS 7064]